VSGQTPGTHSMGDSTDHRAGLVVVAKGENFLSGHPARSLVTVKDWSILTRHESKT